jgi:xylan 1,4-beta-xylosidase
LQSSVGSARIQPDGLTAVAPNAHEVLGYEQPSDWQMKRAILVLCVILAFNSTLAAQQKVTIQVDASGPREPFRHVWSYFGYDEPNFTYARNGELLLSELAQSSPTPVYVRMHNLLTSGDGTPALKWGSTHVYSEDAQGRPVYDWAILDRIFDTLLHAKVKPLVEIGFMPEALSTHPQPYKHDWPKGNLWTGWAYPPKDYQKWGELVYRWASHCVERYGKAQVLSWYWEVWNEPDIGYWQGTPEEYHRLYDYAVDAVKRALPGARVGGPDTTGPADPHAAEFLRGFLEHCARGTNSVTGGRGAPLDFVSFHAKGDPKIVEGHVRMGISRQLQSIDKGFRIVRSFPEFKDAPIILGESDPEGCAACSARQHPQNAYRNGVLYPCYTAEVLARTLELAARYHANLEGVVTWAFEFEDQPYFAGFRTLATNGVDKPILNLFHMLGLMGAEQLPVTSTQAISLQPVLNSGITGPPDVNAIAVSGNQNVSVLIWNYHDEDVPGPEANVELLIKNLPADATRVQVRHYRIDEHHSNACTVWKDSGSPQQPTAEQYKRLLAAGRLEELEPAEKTSTSKGEIRWSFNLPRHAVSLFTVTW